MPSSFGKVGRKVAAIGSIGLLAVAIAAGVTLKTRADRETALAAYRSNADEEARLAGRAVANAFDQIYGNLRTVSFLKSVREIDRHGETLSVDGRQAIQQLYNNIASNVDVSEVYIVPVDLDPEAIDPKTGEKQVPILMFDKVRYGIDAAADAAETAAEGPETEEIYEYRALVQQMATLRKLAPALSAFKNAELPFLTTPPVITCDNSLYEKTHRDADRTGPMYSVPFYDMQGALKGTVTAVLLNRAVASLLPEKNFALIDTQTGSVLGSTNGGQQVASAAAVAAAKADGALLYSRVLDVETREPSRPFKLWVGLPDSDFLDSPEAVAIENFALAGYLFAVAVGAFGLLLWWMGQRALRKSAAAERELQERLAERTAQIEGLAAEQAQAREASQQELRAGRIDELVVGFDAVSMQSVGEVMKGVAHIKAAVGRMNAGGDGEARRTLEVSQAAERNRSNIGNVAAAAEELAVSTKEMGRQMQNSNTIMERAVDTAAVSNDKVKALVGAVEDISTVVKLINDIAGQTNLLALNATIEAARAGEAGKGFAVVAGEVKALANQTARATDEIGAKIQTVRSVTNDAMTTISDVVGTILELRDVAVEITSVLQQQEEATSEVAQSTARVSEDAELVTERVANLTRASAYSYASAIRILWAVGSVEQPVDVLKGEIGTFIDEVKAA